LPTKGVALQLIIMDVLLICAAEIAALLCTKDGYLVQGSPVSGSLANVIFYAKEPSLVDSLKLLGFRYTRYYDDVHISHETDDFSRNIGELRTKVYGVFLSQGLQPHRTAKKSHYANGSRQMMVHGIITNNVKIKPNPKMVSDTRAMLFQMERLLETDYTIDSVVSLYRSIRGKIQTLKAQGSMKSDVQVNALNRLMKKVDEGKAKKFARKVRKIKTRKEYNKLSSKLSVLKKVNVKVMNVVKIECDLAKKGMNKLT
jgi:phage tail tube protein FII